MRKRLICFVVAAAVWSVGCASAADSSAPSDDASEELRASAAPDAVAIENAKAFAEGLLERDEGRAESTIKYDDLPENLRGPIKHDNPNPNKEWAAEAFRTKVLNGKGKNTVVYAIIDGIDDEGAQITLYTSSGKEIASADDYRGFEWNR